MPHRLHRRQPSILFISFIKLPGNYRINASFLYRCFNLGTALAHRGFRVQYSHAFQAIKHLMFSRHDVCVLHRPNGSRLCRAIAAVLKKKKVVTVIDYDDLIFDPHMHGHSPAVIHGHVKTKQILKRFTHARDFAFKHKYFTVSTQTLADVLQRMHPQAEVRVIHNCRLPGWGEQPEQLPAKGHKRLTYFPGSRGHEHDLAVAWPAIKEVMRRQPEIEFHVVGKMDVSELRKEAPVFHMGLLPPDQYLHQVEASWVNLGPLADNPFNQCKSALKMIEATAFGVPTIYSPIEDARRFEGKGCLLADSEQAWIEQLLSLTDPEVYRRQQELAFTAGQRETDIDGQADRFIEFLAGIGV